jgi:hypothetical protein
MTHDGMWFYHCFQEFGIETANQLNKAAIDKYECGVIYRLVCWFDALGLTYRAKPEITSCQMLSGGACGGEFAFDFRQANLM